MHTEREGSEIPAKEDKMPQEDKDPRIPSLKDQARHDDDLKKAKTQAAKNGSRTVELAMKSDRGPRKPGQGRHH